MNKKRYKTRAARKAARDKKQPTIQQPKKEDIKTTEVKTEKHPSLAEEVLKPIARMVGHSLSSALAYAVWCGMEIVVAKTLKLLFHYGTPHQEALFHLGESVMFYAGFAIWFATFTIGAVRMVLAEVRLFGKH